MKNLLTKFVGEDSEEKEILPAGPSDMPETETVSAGRSSKSSKYATNMDDLSGRECIYIYICVCVLVVYELCVAGCF